MSSDNLCYHRKVGKGKLYEEKSGQFNTKIMLHFGCTNVIFVDCIKLNQWIKRCYWFLLNIVLTTNQDIETVSTVHKKQGQRLSIRT